MNKKLKSLEEHDAQQSARRQADDPQLNGIACPRCGEELYDSNPNITLGTYPPQKRMHCNKCYYIGYRIV